MKEKKWGWIVLDRRAKLKIKINFTKQLKGKTTKKQIRTKSIKKSTNLNLKSWLKDKIENHWKSTKKKARKKTRSNLKNKNSRLNDAIEKKIKTYKRV